MPKFEIIVRETRVLKYKVEGPTQQIAIDRIITDSYINPEPYQTTRLNREIYAVDLPEPLRGNQTESGVPWMPSAPPATCMSHGIAGGPMGLEPHPTEPVSAPTAAKPLPTAFEILGVKKKTKKTNRSNKRK